MKNITFHKNSISAGKHAALMGQQGAVLWFTGLSASGKSTVACETERMLHDAGYKTFLLDGDNLRFGLNSDLGFSDEDRDENIRRIAETAKLMAEAGLVVLVSAISPKKAQRDRARKTIERSAVFVEIFTDAPVEVCAERDPKGLYKKACSGQLPGFTGVSAPYEAPDLPDITLKTDKTPVFDCAKKVYDYYVFLQNIDPLMKVLCTTAVEAGKKIMNIYEKGFSVEYKSDNSPLTDADKAADRYINEVLAREYPGIARLSEETTDDLSRRDNDFCFIIDPLDGTREFVERNGEFTVNIGLVHCERAIAGVIYIPVTGELYYACTGRGSFRTTDKCPDVLFPEGERLSVSDRKDSLIVMRSRSHLDEKTKQLIEDNKNSISEVIISGSSIKGCRIAEGSADTYYRFAYTYEWDTCAMQAIVENAGGLLLQGDGSMMTYNRLNTLNDRGFVIANRRDNIWTI